LEDFEEAAGRLARLSLSDTGIAATDLGHLEFYDGFVYFPWLWMEAFGLAKPGEAAYQMTEEQSGTHGRRPLNTGGGSLGMGRIHGGAQVVEAIKQLQGVCGPRQIPDPGPTVVTSGSPLTGCGCLVFTPLGF
jgi:acetyl-CoA acetyltransferase